jgi:hypothetical protein
MQLINLNLISFKSNINYDLFSLNDIKIEILHKNYHLITKTIKDNNNSFFDEKFIFEIDTNEPLTIIVYETNNFITDKEIYKITIEEYKKRYYKNTNLKFYYEIYSDFYLYKNFFDQFKKIILQKKIKLLLENYTS